MTSACCRVGWKFMALANLKMSEATARYRTSKCRCDRLIVLREIPRPSGQGGCHSSTSRYTSQAPETVTSGVPAIILPLKSSTPYLALLVTVSEKKATPNLSVMDTSTSDSVTTTTVPGTPLTE